MTRAYIHLPPVEVEAGQRECCPDCGHPGDGEFHARNDCPGMQRYCDKEEEVNFDLRCPACLAAERTEEAP